MARPALSDIERKDAELIISRLVNTPLLKMESIHDARLRFVESRTIRVFEKGESWGTASDDLPIYTLPQNEFFSLLRMTDNNIQVQIERFNFGLDRWFTLGESHPPYFPWRIIMILSKCGERDLEMRFLHAYCTHFFDGARNGSKKDQLIVERAIGKGAWDYW